MAKTGALRDALQTGIQSTVVTRFHLAKWPEILYPTFLTRLVLYVCLYRVFLGFVGGR